MQQKPVAEFKVKVSSNKTSQSVMLLNSSLTLSDMSMPIRVTNETINYEDNEERPEITSVKKRTRRTRLVNPEKKDEDSESLEQKYVLLEDYDGQHSFVGREEAGQEGRYIFLVNQGNEFKILPVDRWIRFNPSKLTPKISMSIYDEPSETQKQIKTERYKRPLGMDFEEIFDDDEEHDDISTGQNHQEAEDSSFLSVKLSDAGKQMSKIVRHLDKSNRYQWEEDKDPYAVTFISLERLTK